MQDRYNVARTVLAIRCERWLWAECERIATAIVRGEKVRAQ